MGSRWTLHSSGYIVASPPIESNYDKVVRAVIEAMNAGGFAVTEEDIAGKSRDKHIVFSRHLRSFILWGHYNYGRKETGRLAKQDHTTIIHSCSAAVRYIEWDGWAGRAYLKAASILGLKPLDYLHPRTEDRVLGGKEEPRPEVKSPPMWRKKEGREDEYVVPMNWTKEEMDELALLEAYPGGVPESVKKVRSKKHRYAKRKD